MGTIILVIVGIIIAFGLLGFLFSKDGDREENAKVGAFFGVYFIVSLLPTIFVIFIVVMLVKACS